MCPHRWQRYAYALVYACNRLAVIRQLTDLTLRHAIRDLSTMNYAAHSIASRSPIPCTASISSRRYTHCLSPFGRVRVTSVTYMPEHKHTDTHVYRASQCAVLPSLVEKMDPLRKKAVKRVGISMDWLNIKQAEAAMVRDLTLTLTALTLPDLGRQTEARSECTSLSPPLQTSP